MNNNYQTIWELAIPYLKQGSMKDFIVHTKHVVKSMELLIEKEGGEERILIPAAILHDVGFSKIDKGLQCSKDLKEKREAQRQHLVLAKDIIQEILGESGYNQNDIDRIIGIVEVHKFHDPEDKEKQLLIDADNYRMYGRSSSFLMLRLMEALQKGYISTEQKMHITQKPLAILPKKRWQSALKRCKNWFNNQALGTSSTGWMFLYLIIALAIMVLI
jgi:uncharacterized protein